MIDKVKLTNWRVHKELEIDFSKGSNIIVGKMGSGKTSILQAIAFGLFGTFSELKKRELKISDLINRTAKENFSEIELHVRDIKNNKFTITRRIEANKSSEAIVRDTSGKLVAGPNPSSANFYISDKFRLDEELFLRTVYSLQNEADILLRLSPAERKRQVDELMNLHRFETARKYCVSLRNKIGERKKNLMEVLESENKVEIRANIDQLVRDIDKIKGENIELSSELKVVLNNESQFKVELDSLRRLDSELNQLMNSRKSIEKELSGIKIKLAGKDVRLTESQITINLKEYELKKSVISSSKSELILKKNKLEKQLVDLEKITSIEENKIVELSKRISEINELRQKLSSMESKHKFTELSEKIAGSKAQDKKLDNDYRENVAEMNNLRKHIQELETVSDMCPVCRNHLTHTTKDSLISERKREIANRLMKNNEIQTVQKRLKKDLEEFESSYAKQKRILETLELEKNVHSERDRLNLNLGRNHNKIEQFNREKQIVDSEIKSSEDELSLINKEMQNLLGDKYAVELKDREIKLSSELETMITKINLISFKPEELNNSERKYNLTIRRAQEIKTSLSGSKILVKEKELRYKELKDRLKRLAEFEKEIKILSEKIEFLGKLKNAIVEAQEVLRDDLILAVNEVMASIWLEIYPYDSWTSLRLSTVGKDYTLQLKEADGDWTNVAGFASGGERMLASLAAKIAFARVLAPSLNMLILDEPTHNLDEIAVRNFIEIVHENVSEFIEQIFIITHDERLAESANKVVKLI
ncbi:AAA family ATPase [Candidatus Woesearchaeota archaeon]|jgi:DNA repair protein SbcC/Rad50|nr:AAA family ATPase [Candidatus Woesearchaeota archaeon]MBT6023497.1 AAA family ATPase [Candidatus Woesearchaeota archaeon]